MALFLKSQNPVGPIYEQIKKRINGGGSASPAPLAGKTQKNAGVKAGFGVTEEGDKETGPALRIINDGETFVIYPKFGAVIQDWRVDDVEIIPHGLPDFVRKNPRALPGGFRSYDTFGFRPVWALGEHHNPCIIWQYPWRHRIVESSGERIVVEVSLSLEHVDITGRITVEKESPVSGMMSAPKISFPTHSALSTGTCCFQLLPRICRIRALPGKRSTGGNQSPSANRMTMSIQRMS